MTASTLAALPLAADQTSGPVLVQNTVLSLVVPAYGDSPHLLTCLRSLQAQHVVQQGTASIQVTTSTPSAYIAAAAAAAGASYHVNESGGGIGRDWNFALEQAGGGLVALCHQDDVYLPHFGDAMREALAGPEMLMACSDYIEMGGGGYLRDSAVHRVKRSIMRMAFRGQQSRPSCDVRKPMLGLACPVCCPSVALNMQAMPDFRFDTRLRCNLDWDAWDRILRKEGRVAYLDEPLLCHRVHTGSTTSAMIAAGHRRAEDEEILARYLPGAVMKAWMKVYSKAYRHHG